VRRLVLAAVVVLAAACSGRSPAVAPDVPTCQIRFAAPEGFAPLESFEEPYRDRVGVRLGFVDVQRRELHVFAGIRGEFGEGLPEAGTIELRDGRVGTLAGRGDVWIVTWTEGDRCDPRALLASGFDRAAFDATLVEAGLVAAGQT
jgi:hypothetical protein